MELYQKVKAGHTPSSVWKINSDPYTTKKSQGAFQEELISKYKDFRNWQSKGKKKGEASPLDMTFFDEVLVSGTAAIKMLKHANEGANKGLRRSDFPAEVMGCLIGHCPESTLDKKNGRIVIVDSMPLPCKGGAHSAEPDPRTGEALSLINDLVEKRDPSLYVCGWYHSHPFDPEANKHHCFYSQIDVQTHTFYQKTVEERDGVPYVGIVVDPYTSFHHKKFYMGAYRTFPDGETNPVCLKCPDGKIAQNKLMARTRWRNAWNRYYELKITFFATQQVENMFKLLYWYNGVADTDHPDPQKQLKRRQQAKIHLSEAASLAAGSFGSRSHIIKRASQKSEDSLVASLGAAVKATTQFADSRALMQLKEVAKNKLFASTV